MVSTRAAVLDVPLIPDNQMEAPFLVPVGTFPACERDTVAMVVPEAEVVTADLEAVVLKLFERHLASWSPSTSLCLDSDCVNLEGPFAAEKETLTWEERDTSARGPKSLPLHFG